MIAALDVAYHPNETRAVASCVTFEEWTDIAPLGSITVDVPYVLPYEPGAFYRRELPCLQLVIDELHSTLRIVLIDGYVTLGNQRPGLGKHLFDYLRQRVAVVGVAKTAFHDNNDAVPIRRGEGRNPLFVTAAGIDVHFAADRVKTMHGPHRIPTLLKLADTLCRARVR